MKKILSILILIALIAGVLPVTAFAGELAEEPFTRASFCQFLVDGLGLEYDANMAIDFSDVPPTHPNYQAVAILVHMGLLGGYADGTFHPEYSVIRAEAASILSRLGLPASTPERMPSDVNTNYWYYEAVVNVLGTGAMRTDSNGLFRPSDCVYPGEIDLQRLQSLLSVNTTAPVQMDLSKGSITIAKNIAAITVITQGEANIRTEDTNVVIRQSAMAATANTISVDSGNITITLAGVNIEANSTSAISVGEAASLTLNLVGENFAKGGIRGGALTIEGTGSLTAEGGKSQPGIGGNPIVINSGTVTAVGGRWAAGIGGGGDRSGGNITINDGSVTATGGEGGAGIGGGSRSFAGSENDGSGGSITINNGTVIAIGGSWAAGIGGGNNGSGGVVRIIGGEVTATGEYVAIGGAGSSNGISNSLGCDRLTIGETVTLTLSHKRSDGYDLHERIFDLQIDSAAALPGNAPTMKTAARSHSSIDSYQWQTCATNSDTDSDWTDLAGQTAAACTAPMTAELDGHWFRCKITNVYGNVAYTDAAQGFVLAFKQQPQNVETGLNQTAALNATSTCPNVAYRWQRSYDEGETWTDVPGENYSTLLLSTIRSENGALYRCVITASNGDELASNSAQITVDTGEQTYTVRYYQENVDGSGYTVVSQDVLTGEAGQTVTAPEKTFEGFTENPAKGTVSGIVTAQGLILSRYFDRNTYEIAFQMNGGPAVPALSGKYGAPLSAPANPSRYGYQFAGWYADADLARPYTFGVMPLNGTTVYAKWVPQGEGRGNEYRIEELAFRDANTYDPLRGIPSEDFLAEVTVTNLTSTETDTVLLITYDKNGKMLGMSYLYANPQIGQAITLGTRIQNSDGQVGKVKAVVLPSLSSPIPLANAVERT